jgi:hypothetical protein
MRVMYAQTAASHPLPSEISTQISFCTWWWWVTVLSLPDQDATKTSRCTEANTSWIAVLRLYHSLIYFWLSHGSFIYTTASKRILLLLILSTLLHYVSLQKLLEWAECKVCIQSHKNWSLPLAGKYYFVGMLQIWVLSRSISPVEQYTIPLSEEGLHSGKPSDRHWIQGSVIWIVCSMPFIFTFMVPVTPPWAVVSPYCDTHLCNLPKHCTPLCTFPRLCTEVLTHYPYYSCFYRWVWWADHQILRLF